MREFLRNSIFILCMLLLIVPSCTFAQNNPYKINDKVYAYYSKCSKEIRNKKALAMTDTLFAMAGGVHDVKAQCMTLLLKSLYYYYNNDIPNFAKARSVLYKFCCKTPYTQYFFHSWSLYINYLLRKREYKQALNELNAFQKEAYKLKDEYGIGLSFVKLGDVYIMEDQFDLAISQFQKGIDYYNANPAKKRQAYELYLKEGSAYFSKKEFYKSIDCYLTYLNHWEVKSELGDAYLMLACCNFSINNSVEGDKYADLYFRWKAVYKKNFDNNYYDYLLLYQYNLAHKKYSAALLYADSLGDSLYIYCRRAPAYYLAKEYEKAYIDQSRYTESLRKQYDKELNKTLTEYTAYFENEKLKSEKNELALKNSTLKVAQLQSLKQMIELDRQKKSLELSNVHLELNNKNLKLVNQHQEMLKQKAETERLRDKANNISVINQKNQSIASLLALLLIIITVSSFVYILLRRKAEKQLKREKETAEMARLEAEKADKLKTMFLQNMSHEIRTPLNAIVGFSSYIAESCEDLDKPTRNEFLKLIDNNTNQLTTLINDILDLSSLESGYYKVDYGEFNLDELCRQAISTVNGRQKERVELKFIQPKESIILRTDHVRTSQVINNFLTNACKYTEKGSILLTYEKQEQNVVFSVTDTGCGINVSDSDKIFNRFEKLDSFVTGTGIGLNICLRIAELLHGEVKLDKNYHDGARFLFIHPIIDNK